MITERHPFHYLAPLFRQDDAFFTLSKYVYTPDSLMDERELLTVSGDELTPEWIEATVASLRQDQELAFHSAVRIRGRNWHIPMIDFSIANGMSQRIFERMSCYLPKPLVLNMALYASGRSYHAYSTTLLGRKDWQDFMGRLLLINPKNTESIVDTRWIGHRLIGGYSSLRWSNNSGQYLTLPSRVPFP